MLSRLVRGGAMLAATACLLSTGAHAAKTPQMQRAPEEGTIQMDREAVRERRHRLRDILKTMKDTGATKTPGDETMEASPKAPGGPAAPGGLDLDRFARFLRGSLEQSHHQSYEDGYRILRRGIQDAFSFSGIPSGIEVVLRGAYRGADAADKYSDGWEAMYEAMKAVAEDPYVFSEGGFRTFSAICRTTRRITTEKTWENGYKIARAYLRELRSHQELFVDRIHDLALSSALSAADKADKYSDGYKVMVYGAQALADSNSGMRGKGYFQCALAGPAQDMTWENGYKCLMTFAKNYLNSGAVDQFDRVTIRNAIRAADADSQYSGGFRTLQAMFRSLM